MKKLYLIIAIATLLSSCSTFKKEDEYNRKYIVKSKEKTAQKKEYENQKGHFNNLFDNDGNYVGYYKIGKSYKIKGRIYSPKQYEKYEKVGIASWYGGFFNGRKTANGEIFDSTEVTAAHPTLPLPSIVRVTNLENGKMIMVRVNDRGPFSNNRIIDLSEKSAKLLDFKQQGTAKVKVELLQNETQILLEKLNIAQND